MQTLQYSLECAVVAPIIETLLTVDQVPKPSVKSRQGAPKRIGSLEFRGETDDPRCEEGPFSVLENPNHWTASYDASKSSQRLAILTSNGSCLQL